MIALADARATWVVGHADETWWSRLAHPALHTWTAGDPLRLREQTVAAADPDPKALACYGLLGRRHAATAEEVWLRFVDGRPVSAVTTQVLAWCGERLARMGITTLVVVWDSAG